MNEDQLKGRWNELKGKVKERWGRLTDDELTQISGKKEQLLGKIQTKYGIARDRAEKELRRFLDSLSLSSDTESQESKSEETSSRR
ncbi:MAG: CsbD family protein [Chlamydiia bacterium]|nr:CsbD family protein [Chlamydiia bacterium]